MAGFELLDEWLQPRADLDDLTELPEDARVSTALLPLKAALTNDLEGFLREIGSLHPGRGRQRSEAMAVIRVLLGVRWAEMMSARSVLHTHLDAHRMAHERDYQSPWFRRPRLSDQETDAGAGLSVCTSLGEPWHHVPNPSLISQAHIAYLASDRTGQLARDRFRCAVAEYRLAVSWSINVLSSDLFDAFISNLAGQKPGSGAAFTRGMLTHASTIALRTGGLLGLTRDIDAFRPMVFAMSLAHRRWVRRAASSHAPAERSLCRARSHFAKECLSHLIAYENPCHQGPCELRTYGLAAGTMKWSEAYTRIGVAPLPLEDAEPLGPNHDYGKGLFPDRHAEQAWTGLIRLCDNMEQDVAGAGKASAVQRVTDRAVEQALNLSANDLLPTPAALAGVMVSPSDLALWHPSSSDSAKDAFARFIEASMTRAQPTAITLLEIYARGATQHGDDNPAVTGGPRDDSWEGLFPVMRKAVEHDLALLGHEAVMSKLAALPAKIDSSPGYTAARQYAEKLACEAILAEKAASVMVEPEDSSEPQLPIL